MNDIALNSIINRINGDFYVGVVGSVRSGKSSFINKFFELKILPYIKDEFVKNKILDELPPVFALVFNKIQEHLSHAYIFIYIIDFFCFILIVFMI